MLGRKTFQTPNALDPGEEVPVRPNRRAPEVGEEQVHMFTGSGSVSSSSGGGNEYRRHSTQQFSDDDNDNGGVGSADVDVDYPIHDQLPSVEEARMYSARILQANHYRDHAAVMDGGSGGSVMDQATIERSRLTNSVPLSLDHGNNNNDPYYYTGNTQRKTRIFHLLCLIIGIIAFIVIAVVVAQEVKNGRNNNNNSGQNNLQNSSPTPPLATDSSPTPAPHSITVTSPRLNQVLQFLSSNAISDPETFYNKASPQYEAAVWMADRDLLRYNLPNSARDQSTRFVQRYVLVVFYLSTLGPQWTNQLQFLDKTDECSWFKSVTLSDGSAVAVGVTCTQDNEVEGILIPRNQLKGTLPTELALLTSLDFVDMNRNEISGPIPTHFAKLQKLDFFDIRFNQISGPIPEWIGTSWNELILLGFSHNQFTGTIPPTFGQSSLLKTFALDNNQLVGNLDMLNSMTHLEFVFLNDNNLTHSIDHNFMVDCQRLVQLDLSGNFLKGQGVPIHLFRHEKLEVLDLGNNNLDGELPLDITPNTVMKYVALNNNYFQGTLPPTFDQLNKLTHLDLAGNLLDDEIPNSLVSLTGLTYLFLSDNDFIRGPLPSWLSNLKLLRELSLGGSGISGTIPTWLPSLTELVLLDLSGNTMNGQVPSSLWELTKLEFLLLQGNSFTGQLPSGIHDLSDLDLFILDRNNFTGSVDEVCDNLDPEYFIADCDEVSCTCCTACCRDGDTAGCSDDVLYGIMDGSWEYNFTRVRYTFSPEILLDKN